MIFTFKSIFAKSKKKHQSKADLFMKLVGKIDENGISDWITIHDMTGKYKVLIQRNGNTFPREVKQKYGYKIETIYNHNGLFSKYAKNKAVMWRINGYAQKTGE